MMPSARGNRQPLLLTSLLLTSLLLTSLLPPSLSPRGPANPDARWQNR